MFATTLTSAHNLDPRPAPEGSDPPTVIGPDTGSVGLTRPTTEDKPSAPPVTLGTNGVSVGLIRKVAGTRRAPRHLHTPTPLRVTDLIPRPRPRRPHLAPLPAVVVPTVPTHVLSKVAVHPSPTGKATSTRIPIPPMPTTVRVPPKDPVAIEPVIAVRAIDPDLHVKLRLIRRATATLMRQILTLDPTQVKVTIPGQAVTDKRATLAQRQRKPAHKAVGVIAARMRRKVQTARVDAVRLQETVGPALAAMPTQPDRSRPPSLHGVVDLPRLAAAPILDAPQAVTPTGVGEDGRLPQPPRLPPEVDVPLRHARGPTGPGRLVPAPIEVPLGAVRSVGHAVTPVQHGRRLGPIGAVVAPILVPAPEAAPRLALAVLVPPDLEARTGPLGRRGPGLQTTFLSFLVPVRLPQAVEGPLTVAAAGPGAA